MSSVKFIEVPPKATLIHLTPSYTVALATRGYTGKYAASITEGEEEEFWEELGNTALKNPLEFAHAMFLLEDVSRSFTHQMVRNRFASIVQESLRFSVQDTSRATVRIPNKIAANNKWRADFMRAAEISMRAYWRAIESGVATQDARSLLPIGICTRMFISFPMNSLANVYTQRMCCQAQDDEWKPVMQQMVDQITNEQPAYESAFNKPWETGSLSCGFGASFDRPCRFQAAFDRKKEALING